MESRILEIYLKFANFNCKLSSNKVYAVLSISPNINLQTKVISPFEWVSVYSANTSNTIVHFDERFVCLVPQSFLNNKNSAASDITIKFYAKSNFFNDECIGKAVCNLGSLAEPDYDDSSEDSMYFDANEDSIYFDFYENLFIENNNDGDTRNEETTVKKEELPAMRVRDEVAKGLEAIGTVLVEMKAWEDDILLEGQAFASIIYDELMGQEEVMETSLISTETQKVRLMWALIVGSVVLFGLMK